MMQKRRFIQTDVFADEPAKGNALAVVVDGEGLSDVAMQNFAAWTNLAETTFLLPPTSPDADYRVRIFTPAREMPFAGHPTLGSCAAWLHSGGQPKDAKRIVQECQIGLVEIDYTGDVPAFVAPETSIAEMSDETTRSLCVALKIDPSCVVRSAHLDNGPTWQTLELATAEDVLAIDSSLVRWPDFVGVSVFGPHPAGSECHYEVRNLSPSSGMSEDPITGSLDAAIAKWLQHQGRIDQTLLVAQGTCLGRKGRVTIRRCIEGTDQILIGGMSLIVIDGHVHI